MSKKKSSGKISLVVVLGLFLVLVLAGCGGEVKPTLYNVSGEILDSQGNGIPDVDLLFSGEFGTAKSNEEGKWTAVGLTGTVTVTPQKTGRYFFPENRELTVASSSVDFTGLVSQVVSTAQELSDALEDEDIEVVLLEDGTFQGGFVAQYSQIIKAINEQGAIIDAAGGIGIEIAADDVTVSGIKIINAGIYGIFVDQGENGGYTDITINDCYIDGAGNGIYFGIECSQEDGFGGSAKIEGNVIKNSVEHGIRIHTHGDSSGHVIEIYNNQVEKSGEMGIRVFAACGGSEIDQVIVSGNSVSENEGPGIRVHAGKEATINKVEILNNTVLDNGGEGIRVHSGFDWNADGDIFGSIGSVLVQGNGVEDSGCNGIRVHLHGDDNNNGTVSVLNNTVERSDSRGIRVHVGRYLSLAEVKIQGNFVSESFQGEGCSGSEDCGAEGIRVHAGRGTRIESLEVNNNTIVNGLGGGLRIHSGEKAVIDYFEVKNNSIENNAGRGIRLSSCAGNDSQGAAGDNAGVVNEGVIAQNLISNNSHGLYIYTGDNCRSWSTVYGGLIQNITIELNEISFNEYGIYLEANNNGLIDVVNIQENELSDNDHDLLTKVQDGGEIKNLNQDIIK